MKPRLRDYLAILAALLVIFSCGGGIGYLVGEKKGRAARPATSTPPSPAVGDWSERTVDRLDQALDLSDPQRSLIRTEVKATAEKITTSRNEAVADYYRHLLQLHDDVLPHLDPDQQKKLTKDREKLKRLLETMVPST